MMMGVRIDYYNSRKELKSKVVSLEELFVMIKSGRYEKTCSNLSYKLATIPNINPNSTMEDAGKLPVVRFGVGEEGAYTGYVLLSFKITDASMKDQIQKRAMILPQTQMVFEGSSRRSMKVVVAFTLPDGTLPKAIENKENFHQHACYMAVKFYEAQLGVASERKPPRIDRGCRISSDFDVYLNPGAKPMILPQPAEPLSFSVSQPIASANIPTSLVEKSLPDYSERLMMMTKFSAIYNNMNRNEEDSETTADTIDFFLDAIAKECRKNGVDEEFAIQRMLHKTPYGDYEVLVRSIFGGVYGNGVLGLGTPIPDATIQMEQLKHFMRRRYRLQRNAMTGEVDYIALGGFTFSWKPVTKEVLNRMVFDAITEGITVWDKDVKRYVESTFVSDFNPIGDYISGLPTWDGEDRIGALASRVPTDNNRWPEYFHTWLLAMVSQWTGMHKIHGNAMVPLLIGAQGDGKSTFCKLLLPEELRMYYTDRLDFTNKNDAERALTRFALINIDEFDSITKRQQSFLKHILQKSSVMSRQLYSSAIRENKRLAAFVATTNDPCPLTDPTGSRRYLCIRTSGKIDTATPVDYGQLYAQLKSELGAGYRSWFTGEEESDIQLANADFQQFDSLQEQFLSFYHQPSEQERGAYQSISAMIRLMKSQFRSIKDDACTFQKFGRMLKRLGYRHRHVMTGNEYMVVRNSDDDGMKANDGIDLSEGP